ncbi:hypothetical protein Deipr_0728 [Deinococcus proteolyticus MRP]|uniref:Phosphatidylserine decarboxylase n=1 Tax=Deinococcus proteolyticus (strain ATCC 35074 / DSM 20540 / JCM 6276 / NBRC 101906 / NCIMB 13154 / VKM Ac-1939 / CCM 2703 / MRP) TaxID=693977 RepID=F0RLP9_DEIPM|nr:MULTISPECIES: phosphatidylserine decarboxylase [Deinococcus]ADY25888.1 hypothetical protein Deipr_0728 [Deinococcus proteolyticus MRP]MCY1702010.1 hypothetical protein [Deinococcus sp. SL84]
MRTRNLLAGLGAAALAGAYYQRSYRYRDPVRLPPEGAEATGLVAPADGKVMFVRRTEDGWRLGVALDPLSVRYVYAPQDGEVQALTRQPVQGDGPGRPADGLLMAFGDGLGVCLAAPSGKLEARTYFAAGDLVRRGNKLAFLERGGPVLLTFGAQFRPAVRVGERVTGAQTVVARG